MRHCSCLDSDDFLMLLAGHSFGLINTLLSLRVQGHQTTILSSKQATQTSGEGGPKAPKPQVCHSPFGSLIACTFAWRFTPLKYNPDPALLRVPLPLSGTGGPCVEIQFQDLELLLRWCIFPVMEYWITSKWAARCTFTWRQQRLSGKYPGAPKQVDLVIGTQVRHGCVLSTQQRNYTSVCFLIIILFISIV